MPVGRKTAIPFGAGRHIKHHCRICGKLTHYKNLNVGLICRECRLKLKLLYLKCKRCGHKWPPRTSSLPKVCPKCKSPYWNIPRGVLKKGPKEYYETARYATGKA